MPPRSASTGHGGVAAAPHAAGGLACVQILGQGCGRARLGGGADWAGLGWAGQAWTQRGQAWAG